MSDTTTDATTTTAADGDTTSTAATQSDSADKPLGQNGEKALKAERDRATAAEKANAALQKQLDDIAAANLSDLERAQKEAKDAQEVASAATAEALRLRIAAKPGISDEDADLFLTGSDPETLERQASALSERTSTGPKPDLSQGSKGSTGTATGDPATDFASFLGGQMTGRG